ncbi:MAG: hypothetical protein FJY65_10575, partial [Calditrichaeota bacterium]|nr:hypothetical protein [Calditrichota bacterium]
ALAAFPAGEVRDLALAAIFFYLVVYMFMNLGAFWVVQSVERIWNLEFGIWNEKSTSDHIRNFIGLGKTQPVLALMMAVFLFSLTGIPPLAGFVGKFYLLAALVKGKLLALAVITVANTVVSLFYYVRIVRDMFLYEPEADTAGFKAQHHASLPIVIAVSTVVPTLVLGIFFGQLAEWIIGRL